MRRRRCGVGGGRGGEEWKASDDEEVETHLLLIGCGGWKDALPSLRDTSSAPPHPSTSPPPPPPLTPSNPLPILVSSLPSRRDPNVVIIIVIVVVVVLQLMMEKSYLAVSPAPSTTIDKRGEFCLSLSSETPLNSSALLNALQKKNDTDNPPSTSNSRCRHQRSGGLF